MLTKARANTDMRHSVRMLALSFLLITSGAAYGRSTEARLTAAKYDLVGIKTAVDAFAIDCGRYPTTSEGFAALLNCPTNISPNRWHGPYLRDKPTDPWGNDYVYRCPGIHNTSSFDLYSCGADGISKSGGNDDDDINNWDPNSPRGSFSDRLANLAGAAIILLFIVLMVTVSVTAVFSRRVQDLIGGHPTAYKICLWVLLAALLLFLISCLIPRIA
jgi:general secretion pathway protein G